MRTLTFLLLSSLALGAACSQDRTASGPPSADGVKPADHSYHHGGGNCSSPDGNGGNGGGDTATVGSRAGGAGSIYNSVYQFAPLSIMGQPVPLSQYRGRKMLIVNTASLCRYTPQYADLEQLWQQYGNRVVVLGFPSNDFGSQDPGADSSIYNFCTNTYQITFPLFHKVHVRNPANIDPLFAFLRDRSRNGYTNNAATWNFCKYLVDERGVVIGYFPPGMSPMSPTIINAILR